MKRPIFSGHETFKCKTHWLKRGYDFRIQGNNFNDEDAVIELGVGKNMVSSIKYWMRAFGLMDTDNSLKEIANYLLDSNKGKDPYFEDIGTLWLLHFMIVSEDYSTLYKKTFIDFHRQRKEIIKSKLHYFIKATCYEDDIYIKLYNEKTIKKDIDVLLQNYGGVGKDNIEDQNILLRPLHLIRPGVERDTWIFNSIDHKSIPPNIFLFAIISSIEKGARSIPFELLQELSLVFCLNNNELINIILQVCSLYPEDIIFSDNSGIKELQLRKDFDTLSILDTYYK